MSNSYIFQAAIDHCRWKSVLRNEILTNLFIKHKLKTTKNRKFNIKLCGKNYEINSQVKNSTNGDDF